MCLSEKVRNNNPKQFAISLSGREIYVLLNLLEKVVLKFAGDQGQYLLIRDCVVSAEIIRERAEEQGF